MTSSGLARQLNKLFGHSVRNLTFCVIISGLIAIGNADFRFWLATSSLLGLFALYAVTTSIAFVVIRWSYGVGVSITLEKHDNKAG